MNLFPHLLACATCLPDQDTEVARAANLSILFMVVIVFGMLGLLIKIMFNLARKARQHSHLP